MIVCLPVYYTYIYIYIVKLHFSDASLSSTLVDHFYLARCVEISFCLHPRVGSARSTQYEVPFCGHALKL